MPLPIAVVDGHNDLPWELREAGEDAGARDIARERSDLHTDLPRLRRGGVRGQFWSVFVPDDVTAVPDPVATTLEQIDVVRSLLSRYPQDLRLATRPEDLERALDADPSAPIASMMGAEGGHSIGGSLGVLRSLFALGVRYLTLTHTPTTSWADSATDRAVHGGLTEFGREVVREMNRLGMMVDLAHVAESTMRDALAVSATPVIVSHSSCRAVVDHPRNVPDEILRLIADGGGTCMITFVPPFVAAEVKAWADEIEAAATAAGIAPFDHAARDAFAERWPTPAPGASLEDVAGHVEHAREVAGVDHIGLGGDYDGYPAMPRGLEDVSCYPRLFDALRERRWSEAELAKLGGRNVLATWREVEAVAARG